MINILLIYITIIFFSYIYGVVSYGLLQILHCLILPRYPSYYNIKTIFTNLIIIFSYPSPNTNLF